MYDLLPCCDDTPPQSQVPGPMFFTAMDTLQQGLNGAQQQVVQVQDALAQQWPGPLLNASLQVINTRTQVGQPVGMHCPRVYMFFMDTCSVPVLKVSGLDTACL